VKNFRNIDMLSLISEKWTLGRRTWSFSWSWRIGGSCSTSWPNLYFTANCLTHV